MCERRERGAAGLRGGVWVGGAAEEGRHEGEEGGMCTRRGVLINRLQPVECSALVLLNAIAV